MPVGFVRPPFGTSKSCLDDSVPASRRSAGEGGQAERHCTNPGLIHGHAHKVLVLFATPGVRSTAIGASIAPMVRFGAAGIRALAKGDDDAASAVATIAPISN